MSTRRQFLYQAGAAGLLSVGSLPPQFLTQVARANEGKEKSSGRVLVLIQLAGGNDGLNTVIPFGDDAYYRNRPGIAIGRGAVRKLNDYLGLHPQMGGFQELYDAGQLAVIQGVGYPNPDRSHFRSMDIWHSAKPEEEYVDDGWVGRALDAKVDQHAGTVPAISIGEERLPLALTSAKANVPNIQNLRGYRLRLEASSSRDRDRRRRLMSELAKTTGSAGSHLDFLQRTAVTAYDSADQLEQLAKTYKPSASYPRTPLAEKLKLVAQVLSSDMKTEIFFVSMGGYDTHSNQQGGHSALLAELSGAVQAFMQDLIGHKQAERVLVATYSEFGRRVKENGSLGTDHGAASQMFLVSPQVKGGLHGEHPSLTELDRGDLKFHTDFRSVYATLLEKWLDYPSEKVLGSRFNTLSVIS